MPETPTITAQELFETFEDLVEWEERYRFIIELGDELPPLPEEEHRPENLVQGCQSQVWLVTDVERNGDTRIHFRADSDSQITKGLIAVLVMLCSGRTPQEIVDLPLEEIFGKLELQRHLSRSRANGLNSMVKTIRTLAAAEA